MRIHILAKIEFDALMKQNKITDENVEKFDSIFFISLIDNHNRAGHYFKENHENVMNIRFDDVENDGGPAYLMKDDPDEDNFDPDIIL